MLTVATSRLTPDQRRIVEWGDGPLVVIAGAGTGKTRVIVERVRWLLETNGSADDPTCSSRADPGPDLQREGRAGAAGPAGPGRRRGDAGPDDGHELPQLLPADPDRERRRRRAAAAPGRARRRRPGAPAQGHPAAAAARLPLATGGSAAFVQFINRAKDELVTPDDFDAFVAEERRVFEARNGSFDAAAARLEAPGQPQAATRCPRRLRRHPRQRARRGARRDARLQVGRRRQDRRPRGAPHDRRHRARASPQPVPRRPVPSGSTRWPPPTSSMAPRSRSSG